MDKTQTAVHLSLAKAALRRAGEEMQTATETIASIEAELFKPKTEAPAKRKRRTAPKEETGTVELR